MWAVRVFEIALAVTAVGCGRSGFDTPNATDADPNAPDADPTAPDADPNAPDADPNAPDANVNLPDADPSSPDGNPACGTTGTVGPTDDFDDGDPAPDWTIQTSNGSTSVEAGGVVTLTPGTSGIGIARFDSNSPAIAGSRMFVEAVGVTNPATSAFTRLRYGGGSFVEIGQRGGVMAVSTKDGGGSPVDIGNAPYNPVAHAWWQLRSSGGTVFGEVSSDGTNWVILGSGPPPVFANSSIQLGAGTDAAIADPGAAQFDNFNRCP